MSATREIKIFVHPADNQSTTTRDLRIGVLGDAFFEWAKTAIRTISRTPGIWWTRHQQRSELATMVRDGFDFTDIGITAASARWEASKFWWQKSDLRRDGD